MRPSDILFIHNLVIIILSFVSLFTIETLGLWWVSTAHEKEELKMESENTSPKTGDVFYTLLAMKWNVNLLKIMLYMHHVACYNLVSSKEGIFLIYAP